MADVVRISERLSRTPRKASDGLMAAKILLFTGVRYERRDDTAPVGKRPVSRGKKR